METYPLVGNENGGIVQKFQIVKQLKKMGFKKCHNFSWKLTNDNKLFYIYSDENNIHAQTVVSKKSSNGEIQNLTLDLGYIFFHYQKSNKNFHIEYIRTEESFKRMGIASQMLDYAKVIAKNLGARSITLDRLCTYTDGETVLPYRGEPKDIKALRELKSSGKPIIDINLKLYLKNGFIKHTSRTIDDKYLVPMITKNLKPANNKVINTSQVFMLKRKSAAPNIERIKNMVNKNINKSDYKLFNYAPKNML